MAGQGGGPPMQTLEPPIRAMIGATNRGDSRALLEAFSEDAVLTHFGRTFDGRAEISRWNANENIGTWNRIAVTGVTRSGEEGTVTVGIEVSGEGYNGPGTFFFTLDEDRIGRLVIIAYLEWGLLLRIASATGGPGTDGASVAGTAGQQRARHRLGDNGAATGVLGLAVVPAGGVGDVHGGPRHRDRRDQGIHLGRSERGVYAPLALRFGDGPHLAVAVVLDGLEQIPYRHPLQPVPGRQTQKLRALHVRVVEPRGVARQIVHGERHGVQNTRELVPKYGVEEPVLATEVRVHLRLVDPRGVRDAVDTGARDPPLRELRGGGVQYPASALLTIAHGHIIDRPASETN